MPMDAAELGDAMQVELVRRVMALEGREETLRLNNARLETTVDALVECTDVSRANITAIADELARDAATGAGAAGTVGPSYARTLPLPSPRYIASATVVFALVAAALFATLRPDTPDSAPAEAVMPTQQHEWAARAAGETSETDATNHFMLRARLSGAMVDVMHLRVMVTEEQMITGDYPESFEQLGVEASMLTSRNVRGVDLEPGGKLIVWLPAEFGERKWIRLSPELVMGGMSTQWNCEANLPAAMLVHSQCRSV